MPNNQKRQMRIVQVSDLHIGNHNAHLMKNLRDQVKALKPDLIIATGDLADEPLPHLFQQAKDYLLELASSCEKPPAADPERPTLIVMPGNHDVLPGGYGPRWWGKVRGNVDFYESFPDGKAHHYFQPENVWIFGFDSAQKGNYSGGEVRDQDIELFHQSYSALKETYGGTFEDSFKIAVVHHHPLPVNWDKDWRQRWLTMLNAGSFLGAVLHRRMDLVLHGHEHLQAHARLNSTLGGGGSGDLLVFSLGATLRKVANPNQNWFNVITIEEQGDVHLDSHGTQGQFAFAETGVRYIVKSSAAVRESDFQRGKTDSGFFYPHLASITLLNADGDAHRIIECELKVLREDTGRAREHEVNIPYTSGDIQVLEVKGSMRSGLAGISIKENPPPDLSQRNHRLSRTIDFGRTLPVNHSASYQYSWWAVDAFAMDESQFESKYSDDRSNVEFTHFVVDDPIENLLLVVQFPEDFKLPDWPEIRVRIPDLQAARSWKPVGSIERELNDGEALRYIESLHTASLRVSRPQRGLSYGIQWRVPSSLPPGNSFERGEIAQVAQLLLEQKDRLSNDHSTMLLELLARIANITRELLLSSNAAGDYEQWTKRLEISLMIFDSAQRKLIPIKAASFVKEDEEKIQGEIDYSAVVLDYGDGVAGKAFKTNDYRLYVRPVDQPKVRSSYRKLAGVPDPWVLLSLPIRIPSENSRPYGVINLVSDSSDCPLARLGESNSPVTEQDLSDFREEMDEAIFKELTDEMLGKS